MNDSEPEQTTIELPRWLTVQQVADMLGLSVHSVRRLLRSGALPGRHYKTGSNKGIWRVRLQDVRTYIKAAQPDA